MASDGLSQIASACIAEDTPNPEDVYWEGIKKPKCFGKLAFYHAGDEEERQRAIAYAMKHVSLARVKTYLVEIGELAP